MYVFLGQQILWMQFAKRSKGEVWESVVTRPPTRSEILEIFSARP